MISSKLHTIQQHEELIGSRFQIAHLVMLRTKQLMNGAPISKGMPEEFTCQKYADIPNHRYPKVALEELRLGKLKWKRGNAPEPAAIPLIEVNPVVFGS
jgi:DNA-directed RNA polymerase subunit K/omega